MNGTHTLHLHRLNRISAELYLVFCRVVLSTLLSHCCLETARTGDGDCAIGFRPRSRRRPCTHTRKQNCKLFLSNHLPKGPRTHASREINAHKNTSPENQEQCCSLCGLPLGSSSNTDHARLIRLKFYMKASRRQPLAVLWRATIVQEALLRPFTQGGSKTAQSRSTLGSNTIMRQRG